MLTSTAFISYHHHDKIIGEAIYDELLHLATLGKGKASLRCFLDANAIDTGSPWQPAIDAGLKDSDWLIVIFTGEQSVYCGYEVGTFSQIVQTEQTGIKRIVGLYDVGDIPVILNNRQNVYIDDVADAESDQEKVTLSTTEANKWYESRVGKFLREFCNYKLMYTASDDPQNYPNNIALSAKKIANAFAIGRNTDIKRETPVQISFEITIKVSRNNSISKIPDNADVLGTALFFSTLGLSISYDIRDARPPTTTWAELRKMLVQNNKMSVPWMNKVDSDIINAIKNHAPSGNNAIFRANNNKIYQPVLDRHTEYMNGDRRFYLMFVETPDRRFSGSPKTSLLLACLILASRWRFMYLENWNEKMRNFSDKASLKKFTTACVQLDRDINDIEVESAELGATNRRAMIEAFGNSHQAQVEQFFVDWEDAKKKLYLHLPKIRSEITQENRPAISTVVTNFLLSTRQQNVEFLRLVIDTYGDQVRNLEMIEHNG